MKLSRLVVVALVAILVPAQALAAVCIKDQFSTVYILDVGLSTPSGYVLLVGEAVGGSGNFPITNGSSFGLTGSAHLRAVDGKAHISFSVPADDPDNFPFWVQGTLDPPAFTSGSGFVDRQDDDFRALTFSPAVCPAAPPQ